MIKGDRMKMKSLEQFDIKTRKRVPTGTLATQGGRQEDKIHPSRAQQKVADRKVEKELFED